MLYTHKNSPTLQVLVLLHVSRWLLLLARLRLQRQNLRALVGRERIHLVRAHR